MPTKAKALTTRQRALLHDLARGYEVSWAPGLPSYTIHGTAPRREYCGYALIETVGNLVRRGYAITTRTDGFTSSRYDCTITDAGRAALEALP